LAIWRAIERACRTTRARILISRVCWLVDDHLAISKRTTFKRFLGPRRHIKWVVYIKAPFTRSEQVLRYLSCDTHRVAISNRRPVAAGDGGVSFRWKDYLDDRPHALENVDAGTGRVHPALPDPCAAQRLPPNPSLRPPCQWQPGESDRQGPRVARHGAGQGKVGEAHGRRGWPSEGEDLSLLRVAHAHHRSHRPRLHAQTPTRPRYDQD
jgi:hypothetical protein